MLSLNISLLGKPAFSIPVQAHASHLPIGGMGCLTLSLFYICQLSAARPMADVSLLGFFGSLSIFFLA